MRNPPFKGDLPSSIKQVGSISEARSHSLVFECGDETECDILLLCTGIRPSNTHETHMMGAFTILC
jgi:hypothetical protein